MKVVWVAVVLVALLAGSVYSAVSQPTHAIVKDIIKTYILSLKGSSQSVKIVGLGSWVFGRKYRDPLGALKNAKPSDHDMFLVCDLADEEALAEWKAFRKHVVSEVTTRFGGDANKILENINIYPPEQLMEGVDSPSQALCRFKELGVNPNLAGGSIDGWWGRGSRAWKDAYAASNGKIWWNEAGKCRVGIADALNHRTACQTYTLAGAANVSTSIVENSTASILAGDAGGFKKNLVRLRSTIAKGRSLAGLNPDPFLDGVLAKLKQFDETPEGLKKLKDFLTQNSEFGEEVAQALEKARFQSAALKLLTEKPNARLASSIFDMLQEGTGKWARAKNAMMKLAGKVPWRAMIGATAAFLIALDMHDTYNAYQESDYEKLMGKFIINAGFSAGLGTGSALMLTQAVLDDAKEYGYSLAIQRQDADDLLAGIYQVSGREKLVDDKTLEQSIERLATEFTREEDVRKLVMERACDAAKREDGGVNTAKVDQKLAGKIYDKCADVIVRRWKEKRADMIADCGMRLTDSDQYFPVDLLTATIQPEQLPAYKPGTPISVEVRVNLKGDIAKPLAVLKEVEDGLKRLGTGTDPVSVTCYNQFTWILDGKVVASDKKDLYLKSPVFSRDSLTRNISLNKAGSHELELQMETRFRVDTAPSDVTSARKFLYRRFMNTVKVPLDLEPGTLGLEVELPKYSCVPKNKFTVKAIIKELPAEVESYTFEWTDVLSNTVLSDKGNEMSFVPAAPGLRRFRVRAMSGSGKDAAAFAEHVFTVQVAKANISVNLGLFEPVKVKESAQLKAVLVGGSNPAPTSVRYVWKIGDKQVGTGDTLTYTAPGTIEFFDTYVTVYAYPTYSDGEAPPVECSALLEVSGKEQKGTSEVVSVIDPDSDFSGYLVDGKIQHNPPGWIEQSTSGSISVSVDPGYTIMVGQTAKITAKVSGCTLTWSGEVAGNGETVSFTPTCSGPQKVSVNAAGGGIEMVESIWFDVKPMSVELERLEPASGDVQISAPIKIQMKMPENLGAGKKLSYHWYSSDNASFESEYTDTPETKVRFWQAGFRSARVDVFVQEGDGLVLVAKSEYLGINVIKPELKVTLDPQQPMVGQPLILKVEAPSITTGLSFEWELPEQWSETGESINSDSLEVIPTSSGEAVVKLSVREDKYYGEVGSLDIPVSISEYSVKASTETLGPKPRVWDPQKGLVEEVPNISVFQYISLKAELQPDTGIEPVKFVWKLNEDSHFAFAGEGSEVTAYRSQAGECLATVTAYDKAGVELGKGSTSFSATISQDRISEAKTKVDDAIKNSGGAAGGVQNAGTANTGTPNTQTPAVNKTTVVEKPKPADKPVTKPVDPIVAKPADKPVTKPVVPIVAKPVDKPVTKPVDPIVVKPVDKPVTKPVDKPAGTETTKTGSETIASGTRVGDVSTNQKDGAEMVWVSEGEFLMGSDISDDEKPQHKVYLDGYWMYKNEVTVAQYRKFCSETGSAMPGEPRWGLIDNHPIANVTWQDAADYAKWAGTTLPTEAQWEKAARGVDGRKYPWGNEWDASKCNEGSGGPKKTQPVGSYPAGASPYGCMDMAGNVWEWCSDWYVGDYYGISPVRNPTGPPNGDDRVLRGGGWNSNEDLNRCSLRFSYGPNVSSNTSVGFRCARTQGKKPAAVQDKPAAKPVVKPETTETPKTPPETKAAGAKLGDVSINPKDAAEMVWVPEGEFLMGSDISDDEKPQRKVNLDGYWIYRNEVTVARYKKFCSDTGKAMPEAPRWGWIDSHPIVNVTWQEAADYAKWAGVSLPTEAQWEKAARGTDGRTHPWGNEWDASKCNEGSGGPQMTQPVGSYPAGASLFGCMDMAGNVWEWCSDWYAGDYYTVAPARNPKGPSEGDYRVLRGGAWLNKVADGVFRSSYRDRYDMVARDDRNGFRCVKAP